MFNATIKSIIDLLKLRKDSKKTDLEIEKLKREQKNAESMIKIAPFEAVERFDPKVRKLINMLPYRAARKKENIRRKLFVYALIAIFVLFAIFIIIYIRMKYSSILREICCMCTSTFSIFTITNIKKFLKVTSFRIPILIIISKPATFNRTNKFICTSYLIIDKKKTINFFYYRFFSLSIKKF